MTWWLWGGSALLTWSILSVAGGVGLWLAVVGIVMLCGVLWYLWR